MAPSSCRMSRPLPRSCQPMVTLPPCGLLSSPCSIQSPYQRCVPSLLANEPVSKLIAHVRGRLRGHERVGGDLLDAGGGEHARMLGIGEFGLDGVDDVQARNDFAAGGSHRRGRSIRALRLDDVAVCGAGGGHVRGRRAGCGRRAAHQRRQAYSAKNGRSQDSSSRLFYRHCHLQSPLSGPSPLARTAPLKAGEAISERACVTRLSGKM